MASLSEILIIRGLMPITSLDFVRGDPDSDDAHVQELLADGIVTESQVASARATQLGLPFVDLIEYPVDRTAVALVPVGAAAPAQRAADRSRWRPAAARHGRPARRVRHRRRARQRPDARCARSSPSAATCSPRSTASTRRRRAQRPHDRDRRGERPSGTEIDFARRRRRPKTTRPIVRFVNLLDQPGHPGPRLRHPHRAGRARHARALPHRRRAARDAAGAQEHPERRHLAPQDHERHRHRRAPQAAGRPHVGHATAAARSTSVSRPCRRCGARRSSCVSSTTRTRASACERPRLLDAQLRAPTRRRTPSRTA